MLTLATATDTMDLSYGPDLQERWERRKNWKNEETHRIPVRDPKETHRMPVVKSKKDK